VFYVNIHYNAFRGLALPGLAVRPYSSPTDPLTIDTGSTQERTGGEGRGVKLWAVVLLSLDLPRPCGFYYEPTQCWWRIDSLGGAYQRLGD